MSTPKISSMILWFDIYVEGKEVMLYRLMRVELIYLKQKLNDSISTYIIVRNINSCSCLLVK